MSGGNKLELYFSSRPATRLERTVFTHELLSAPMVSVLGTPGAAGKRSSCVFPWTAAVQTIASLLVSSKLESEPFILEGGEGSAASSLDAALSKPPNWLLDMFGSDSHGSAIAGRLFKRSNPERKRPGPVAVALNPSQLGPEGVRVFIDMTEAGNTQLQELAQALRRE